MGNNTSINTQAGKKTRSRQNDAYVEPRGLLLLLSRLLTFRRGLNCKRAYPLVSYLILFLFLFYRKRSAVPVLRAAVLDAHRMLGAAAPHGSYFAWLGYMNLDIETETESAAPYTVYIPTPSLARVYIISSCSHPILFLFSLHYINACYTLGIYINTHPFTKLITITTTTTEHVVHCRFIYIIWSPPCFERRKAPLIASSHFEIYI